MHTLVIERRHTNYSHIIMVLNKTNHGESCFIIKYNIFTNQIKMKLLNLYNCIVKGLHVLYN